MSDVFISYKAEDRRRVQPLVQALHADGLSVWWDEDIGVGNAWRETIERQLDEAKCVVVIWSKRSVGPAGDFVRDEASRAKRRGIYVPVRIDKVDPPLGFGETQAIDLRSWKGDPSDGRFRALVGAVQDRIGGPARQPLPRRRSPLVDRRTAMIGAGAATAVCATGAGVWLLTRSGAAEAHSIAVLPFANASGDPSQAYFADGIADELRSALARVPGLTVIGRTSSAAVRNDDARIVGRKLGVSNIVSGTVREFASTVRVSAQLIDSRTGVERWSEDFEQPLGDSSAIQTRIARSVAEALRLQLSPGAAAGLGLGGTRNVAAHDLYLQAGLGFSDDSADGIQRTIAMLDKAIALDPDYAQAYARKAVILGFYSVNFTHSPSEMANGLDQVVATAKRAVAIAPGLSQAHGALASAYRFQVSLEPAWREFQIAARLPGMDSETEATYAAFLASIGRKDDAVRAGGQAVATDPLNPQSFTAQAVMLHLCGYFERAITAARRSLELAPSTAFARYLIGTSLLVLGRYTDAAAEYSKIPADQLYSVTGPAFLAARRGDDRTFGRLVTEVQAMFGETVNYELGQMFAQRGNGEAAIEHLAKAVAAHNPGVSFLMRDPLLDPIRRDPRVGQLIRTAGFPS